MVAGPSMTTNNLYFLAVKISNKEESLMMRAVKGMIWPGGGLVPSGSAAARVNRGMGIHQLSLSSAI